MKTCVVEQDVGLSFVYKLKSTEAKERYVEIAKASGLYRKQISPFDISEYVAMDCHYKMDAEVVQVFRNCFAIVCRDTRTNLEIKGSALKKNFREQKPTGIRSSFEILFAARIVVHPYLAFSGLSTSRAQAVDARIHNSDAKRPGYPTIHALELSAYSP